MTVRLWTLSLVVKERFKQYMRNMEQNHERKLDAGQRKCNRFEYSRCTR